MRDQITMVEFAKLANGMDIRTIVEVGSLDGCDARELKTYCPEADCYAIEGNPNLPPIEQDGVVFIRSVVSNFNGHTNFYIKRAIQGITGIDGMYDRGPQYGTEIIRIPCYRLDTICRIRNIQSIDMMKIDVEGASYDVLVGMGDLLNTVKIMHIETEIHEFFRGQKLHPDVCQKLAHHGFKIIDMTQFEITPGRFQCDSVWAR